MKTILFSVCLVFSIVSLYAQDASLVGKWKVIKISDKEMIIDLRDKDGSSKKMMEAAKAKDADFTKEDSMMVEFAIKMLTELFSGATMEFKPDGKFEFITQMDMGGKKKEPEQGIYTVDKAAKTITTTVTNKANRPPQVQAYEIKDALLHLTFASSTSAKPMTLILEK